MSLKKLFIFLTFIVLFNCTSLFAQKVRIRSQITPNCGITSNSKFSDIYAEGNIAVMGSYSCRGVFIFDISNPDAPVLSSWYNPGANLQFLEAIVIGNRGYFGSGNGGGVHIVDLTTPSNPVLLGVVNSTTGNGHNSIHEMMIWNNILIENANTLSNKTIKFINVSNPANPVFIRDFNPLEVRWVHAFHIRGNRFITSGWGTNTARGLTEIYDIANVATQAPQFLGSISDSSADLTAGNSMHSSWSSEDGNYLYSCRETSNGNGDVRVYNITNPANPLLVRSIGMNALGINAVTPHNPVVMGNYLYVAWYQAGLQVFDISTPSNPVRVGQYDTFQPAFAQPEINEQTKAINIDEPWDMFCGSDKRRNSLPTTFDGNWAVYPFLGTNKILTGDLANGLQILDVTEITAPLKNRVSDFDGDGKTDFSAFTPNSGSWRIERSSNSAVSNTAFGISTDKPLTGDFDGDDKSDIAIWRASSGDWWIQKSSDGTAYAVRFGISGDVPVPADYDADGKTDIAVWRPSNGIWYIRQSTLGFRAVQWGSAGDTAITGDFEGDGKADQAIWRPSNGVWYVLPSSSSIPIFVPFGINGDKPIAGDFDGDGKSDYAVIRAGTNKTWYVFNSLTNSLSVSVFGLPTDIITAADYDGDNKTDISVFRPATNEWYRVNSSNNVFVQKSFGQFGDAPLPNSVQP